MSQTARYFFPPYRLDAANQQLWCDEKEISLRPKTFEILRYLVERRGQLVTKTMLLDAVWPGVVVSDSMPATSVAELREALGDDARKPRFIETVHRRGYRFIAKVNVAAVRDTATAPPDVLPAAKQTLVGRQAELQQLGGWYRDVLDGRRRVIFVAGEAGIGKTAFAQAFLDSISHDNGMRIGRGQCLEQYGAGEAYMPVLEALSRLARVLNGEFVGILRRFAPTWLAQMPELLTPEERARLQQETQGVTQHRMLREMAQALEALADETPLILLLEDLHWSDFSTLELISAIARRSEPARLMLIGTFRPVEILANDHPLRNLKQELELHSYCQELELKLLSEKNVAEYLATRFAGNGQRQFENLAPIIHARTDGNPLFMINVVDYLIGRAGLAMRRQEASGLESLIASGFETPRNIRDMIERNLERLKVEDQAVLEAASVVGPEFSAASVAAALERPQDEIEACCVRLSRREQFVCAQGTITWPDGTIATGFRFHHALYQEVLYGRLPIGHQIQLHRRIAAREELGYGDHVGEVATQLAHHYSLANVKSKALQYFQLAGERAVARGAMVEAEEQYRCALKLLNELPRTNERDHRELELQLAVASALVATKGWAALETELAYTRAGEICDRLGDSPDLLPALFGIYAMYLVRGDVRSANLRAQDLMRRAVDTTDSGLKLYAHIALGVTAYFIGDFRSALEHLNLGLSLYDVEQHSALILRYGFDAGVWCLCYVAATLWHLGYADRALARCEEALELAQKLSNPINLAQAKLWTSIIQQFQRAPRPVLETTRSVIAIAVEHELTDWQDWAGCLYGWALASVGRAQEGIKQVKESRARLGAKGAGIWRPYFLSLLAEACLIADLVDEGIAAATEALQAEVEYDEHQHAARIHCLMGELFLRRAGPEAAEQAQAHFQQAIEIARAQSAKMLELHATTRLARLLAHQGLSDQSRMSLGIVYDQFTEGFDTQVLKEAKALLDELSGN